MSDVCDLSKGNVRKIILAFYFPMFFTNMLQQVYTFVDMAIVGKGLGDHALAAVGNLGSLSFLIVGFSIGLANGFSVLIAQCFGAKKYNLLRHMLAASIILTVIMGVGLTAFSLINLEQVLVWLRTDSIIMRDSLAYGYVIFGGLGCSLLYNVSASVLRALGDSKTPLKAIILSSVLNLILDCLFIFGFGMGVEGAALATVISQLVSSVVCLNKLRKIEFVQLKREDYSNSWRVYWELLRNGIPMACMNSITAIGCMVVQYFVNGFGVDYTSAYSACSRYINMFMQPACTAGNVMSSYTSQNYGAKEFQRIEKGLMVCGAIALISYAVLGGAMVLFSKQLAGILLTQAEPIAYTSQFLITTGIMIFTVDLLFVFRSGVQGMGHPTIPMLSGILEMVLRIGTIVIFSERLGFQATAYAEVFAWSGALIMNFVAFWIILFQSKKKMQSGGCPRRGNIFALEEAVMAKGC